MELPGSAYLYTLASLSMTFAGFCAIVIVLRQTTGKDVSGFHIVLTRLYLESGLFSAAFCMLPPLLALCGLSATSVWRVSSAIIAVVLLCYGAAYPMRRAAYVAERVPRARWVPIVVPSALVVAALIGNALGTRLRRRSAPLLSPRPGLWAAGPRSLCWRSRGFGTSLRMPQAAVDSFCRDDS